MAPLSSATTLPQLIGFDELDAELDAKLMGADTLARPDASSFALPQSIPEGDRFSASRTLGSFLDVATAKVLDPAKQVPFVLGGTLTIGDAVDNVLQGVRKGSLVLPDPQVEPDNPYKALQIAGIAVGAVGEGFATEVAILKGLVHLTKRGGALAGSAENALRLFGQAPGTTFTGKFLGGAALGATAEVGLRAGTGRDPLNVLAGAGLVAAPGFVLGGTAAAVTRAAPDIARAGQSVRQTLEPALQSKLAQSIHRAGRKRPLEVLGEKIQAARDGFQRSFKFEAGMERFPGFDGDPRFTYADELRVLGHTLQRADTRTIEHLQEVIEPIQPFLRKHPEMYEDFMDMVILRDLQDTAQRGLATGELSLDDIQSALRALEVNAAPEVAEAVVEGHGGLVQRMWDELEKRGKVSTGGYEGTYFPHHHIVQRLLDAGEEAGSTRKLYPTQGALRTPTRSYTRERGGSKRAIVGDYLEVMHTAVNRFIRDNALDDFIAQTEKTFGVSREALPKEVLKDLDSSFRRSALPDGTRLRVYTPSTTRFFRTNAIDDASKVALEKATQEIVESADMEEGAKHLLEVKVREVLAAGKTKEIILPEDIALRLEKFSEQDPLYITGGIIGGLRRGTAEWKRNTIYWGLTGFGWFQLIGDGVNALRSFGPGIVMRTRSGRLSSPAWTALRAQFAHYRTPMLSPEQVVRALGGGAIGAGAGAALPGEQSAADLMGTAMVGAGLGYIRGTGKVAGTLPKGAPLARWYEEADQAAAITTGKVFNEEDLARRTLGRGLTGQLAIGRTPVQRVGDTALTLLTGKTHGDPADFARNFSSAVEVIQNERENWLRLAAYVMQREDGVPEKIAAKRAREALVDYGKFTDFENKALRGFLLPFYAFYRQNIPNWWKTLAGKDVGGKPKAALIGLAGIAGFDVAAQAWNEQFFPEIEGILDPAVRKGFHIIMGNPATGEAYRDKNGKVMLFGVEMPYEQALEFAGLARPGVIWSEFLGMGIHGEDSMTNRALRIDEWEHLPKPAKEVMKGMGDQFIALLTPFVKVPGELMTNTNWYFGSPIVQERYFTSPERKREWLEHTARSALRQYREIKRVARQVEEGGFDPLSSSFGVGLPLQRVDVDRQIQRRLHDRMREAAQATDVRRAKWMRQIDDIVFERPRMEEPTPEEWERVQEVIQLAIPDPEDHKAAVRYYTERVYKASLFRHWETLSMAERARFADTLEEGDLEALFYYMNGGQQIEEDAGHIPAPSMLF